jgi:hypothetical protein
MPSTNLLAIHNPAMHFCIEFLCILCWQNSGTTALSNNRALSVHLSGKDGSDHATQERTLELCSLMPVPRPLSVPLHTPIGSPRPPGRAASAEW